MLMNADPTAPIERGADSRVTAARAQAEAVGSYTEFLALVRTLHGIEPSRIDGEARRGTAIITASKREPTPAPTTAVQERKDDGRDNR